MVVSKKREKEQKNEGYLKMKNSSIGEIQEEIDEYSNNIERLKLNFYKKQMLCIEFEDCYDKLRQEAEEIADLEILEILERCYQTLCNENNAKFAQPENLLEGTGFEVVKRK